MALIRMNHLSFCKGNQTEVSVILPTKGMDDKRNGTGFEVPGMKYQTLWLLHGGGGDNTDFVNFSNIVRYAEKNRLAVVMPAGTMFFSTDYEYITEELPETLRCLFPLSDKREDNFICGLSHGGDAAMKAIMEHPDRYATAVIMSAAGTDHKGPVDKAELRFDVWGNAERIINSEEPKPELIFATGTGDRGFSYYVPIIDKLDSMGLNVKRHYVDGDGHSWDFWDDTIRTAIDEWLPIRHDIIRPEE
jgi:S-formylglutathione hydrolase FrmB